MVARWLSPVLIGLSLLLLGRAYHMIYFQRRGSRTSKVLTWLSTAFVVVFWAFRLIGTP